MTDIRTAAMNLPTAADAPTPLTRHDPDARLLKKILAIRPVLADRERDAATRADRTPVPAR